MIGVVLVVGLSLDGLGSILVVRASAFAEMWIEMLAETAAGGKGPQVFGDGTNPINFVSVEETKRVNDLLQARRADLEALMMEWEEVAQLIEANS